MVALGGEERETPTTMARPERTDAPPLSHATTTPQPEPRPTDARREVAREAERNGAQRTVTAGAVQEAADEAETGESKRRGVAGTYSRPLA